MSGIQEAEGDGVSGAGDSRGRDDVTELRRPGDRVGLQTILLFLSTINKRGGLGGPARGSCHGVGSSGAPGGEGSKMNEGMKTRLSDET